MTPEEIYDALHAKHAVKDPACVKLGDRCIVGRWEEISEELPNGHICRAGKVAIIVLGEASTWDEANALALARLAS